MALRPRVKRPLLFTENDTNTRRISGQPNASPYVKDAIDSYVVHDQRDAVNPAGTGTKAAAHHQNSRRRDERCVPFAPHRYRS